MEGKLIWPVAGSAPITQGFGGNPQTYARFGLAGHNGLDFGVPPVLCSTLQVSPRAMAAMCAWYMAAGGKPCMPICRLRMCRPGRR